jgi:hypothetical protein
MSILRILCHNGTLVTWMNPQLFWDRYIALGRPQQKTLFPNNSSIVIEVCLPRHRIETAVLLLLRVFISEGTCLLSCCLAMNYSGFQASCYIVPSLRLFVQKGLQVYRHFSFFRGLCLVSPSFPWLGFSAIYSPTAPDYPSLKPPPPERLSDKVRAGPGAPPSISI